MKKFRLFILAILCISMCLVCTKDIQVLAEELPNNIVLEGASEGIIFIRSSAVLLRSSVTTSSNKSSK